MVFGLWSCLKARYLHTIYIDPQCNVLYLCSIIDLIVLFFLINFEPYKSSVSHYTIIDITFLILLVLHYISILGADIIVQKDPLSHLHIGILYLLYSNYLPNLHNTAMDVLEKEMEWEILNKSEDIANEQKWMLNCYFKEGDTMHL